MEIIIGNDLKTQKEYIIDKIKEDVNNLGQVETCSKIVLLVPEQKTNYSENLMCNVLNGVNLDVEVLSFNRMPYTILRNISKANRIYVDEIVKRVYIKEILIELENELNLFNSGKLIDDIINVIETIILKQIDIESLDREIGNNTEEFGILGLKIQDIVKIYKKYQEKKIDLLDKEEALLDVLENIEKSGYFKNANVYITDFISFTPIQHQILTKIVNESNKVYINLPLDNIIAPNDNFEYSKYTLSKIISDLEFNYSKKEKDNSNNNDEKLTIKYKIFNYKNKYDQKNDKESYEVNINDLEKLKFELRDKPIELLNLFAGKNENKVKLNENTLHNKRCLKDESIILYSFDKKDQEIEYVANDIYNKIKYQDIALDDIRIVMNDAKKYKLKLERIFSKYNININIDGKIAINNTEIAIYIKNLLNLINLDIWSIIDLLKTNVYLNSKAYLNKSNNLEELENEELITDVDIYNFEKYIELCKIRDEKILDEYKYFKNSPTYKKAILVQEYIRKYIFEEMIELLKTTEEYKNNDNLSYNLENIKKIMEQVKQTNFTGKQISTYIYNHIQRKGVADIIFLDISEEQNEEEKEKFISVINLINDGLDRLSLIENCTFEEYIQYMNIFLSNSTLYMRDGIDYLKINNINTYNSGKYTYILSCDEENFPTKIDSNKLITNRENEKLLTKNMAIYPTEEETLIKEKLLIYTLLTQIDKQLILTYAKEEEGDKTKEYLPSIYYVNISQFFKIDPIYLNYEEKTYDIKEEIDINSIPNSKKAIIIYLNNLISKYEQTGNIKYKEMANTIINNIDLKKVYQYSLKSNIVEDIQPDLLELIYGGSIYTSISRLEGYARCPFAYHLRYVIGLNDSQEYEIQRNDIGNFIHDVLKEVFDEVKKGNLKIKNRLKQLDIYTLEYEYADSNKELADEIKEYKKDIEDVVNEKIKQVSSSDKYEKLNMSEKNKVFSKKIQEKIQRSCISILETIRLSDYNIYGSEVEFGANKELNTLKYKINDNRVDLNLVGKIDRIDISDDNENFRIIDYKYSEKKLDTQKIIEGLQLQLLTYSNIVHENLRKNPKGVFYDVINKRNALKGKELRKIDSDKKIKILREDLKLRGKLIVDKPEDLISQDLSADKPENKSIINAYIKDGEVKSREKGVILTSEEFETLNSIAEEKVIELATDIVNGKIDISPIVEDTKSNCEYCSFKNICKVNSIDNPKRKIKNKNKI